MKPLFSIVIITKDEANTLPRLFESLKEFKERGGEVCILDTGSTDDTVKIAQDWGAKVFEHKFTEKISAGTAKKINEKFLVGDEEPIVKEGSVLFNFADARNFVSLCATNDMICTMDADEAYTRLDIDAINGYIEEGYEQFEYQFVFAHDYYGRPAIQFIQSKFFDRRKAKWDGIVHEVLQGATKLKYLDESIIKLEHFQEPGKEHRGNYLVGLALDCFENPGKDRQSHYFARELMYTGRFKSAIREFEHHITMNGWIAERAQSMIYMGKCYGFLNDPFNQAIWYSKAFYHDPTRRAALMELALFYKHQNAYPAAAAYASAALEIPWVDYYANEKSHYEDLPHAVLYWAKGWMGDIKAAQDHLLKALEYQPFHPEYLDHTKYYFEYPDNGIEGWMRFTEQQFLYHEAKKHKIIVEVGSWKGKSTHAICSGCKDGIVYAVDTWQGSIDEKDDTHWLAQREDVYETFKTNTNQFENLIKIKKPSVEGAKWFEDGSLDMVFIDAGHTYEAVIEDIEAWLPKVKPDGIICGHDYLPGTWMDVIKAVDEKFGKPDSVEGYSIWKVDLGKRKEEARFNTPTPDEIELKVTSVQEVSIPQHIFTCWLSDNPVIPPQIQKCIDSQKIEGYDHTLITLEWIEYACKYIHDAIKAKKWVKAVDYLRMWTLKKYGGIFLDADVEILPGKNFNEFLNQPMFAAKEEEVLPEGVAGLPFIGYSVVGSIPNHPIATAYLEEVESRFKGDDDFYFESSMEIFTKLVYQAPRDLVHLCPPETFYPYNHKTGLINVTDDTVCFHHFLKSWKKGNDLLPTVSIIIPTLGRKEGLKRCEESIDKLYYPKHLIEIVIVDGDGMTVPEKVKIAVAASDGDIICYAANDMEFTPWSLYRAVQMTDRYSLIAFNSADGLVPYEDETKNLGISMDICEHFIIKRNFIQEIGGEIFDTRLKHVGVDSLLWAKASELDQAAVCKDAIINHYHFSRGAEFDDVYKKGWANVKADRAMLKELLNGKRVIS